MTNHSDNAHAHRLTDLGVARKFVLAGNAYFTVRNEQTGNRITYRVVEVAEEGRHDVFVFTGSENSDPKHYTHIGLIKDGEFRFRRLIDMVFDLKAAAKDAGDKWLLGFAKNIIGLVQRGRSLTDRQMACLRRNACKLGVTEAEIPAEDMKVQGFRWLWARLNTGHDLPDIVEFWTEGRCGKCARRLTVPSSILAGFGPKCAAALSIDRDLDT